VKEEAPEKSKPQSFLKRYRAQLRRNDLDLKKNRSSVTVSTLVLFSCD